MKQKSRIQILDELSIKAGKADAIENFDQFCKLYNSEAILQLVYMAMSKYELQAIQSLKANPNIAKEIRDLEAQGVFIHLSHDHHENGSNCIWSLEFTKPDGFHKVGGYGDGDTVGCYAAAFRLAKFLLGGENLKWYFYSAHETVTPEGHANWMKSREVQEQAHAIVFKKDEPVPSNKPEGFEDWCAYKGWKENGEGDFTRKGQYLPLGEVVKLFESDEEYRKNL